MDRNSTILLLQNKTTQEQDVLQQLIDSGIIDEVAVAKAQMNNKERKLKEVVDLNRIKQRNDGRYYIHIGKALQRELQLPTDVRISRTREKLIDDLFQLFYGITEIKLEEAYNLWQRYRIEIGTQPKTIHENANDWNKYLKGTRLAAMKVKEIQPIELKDFFMSITAGYGMTNKAFSNLRGVLNGIFIRCMELGIVQHNIVNEIDYRPFKKRFKPVQTKDDYSKEDKTRLLEYLRSRSGVYEDAIRFALNTFLRFSELISIKYSDVQGDFLFVKRATRAIRDASIGDDGQIVFAKTEYQTEERIKGSTDYGFRMIPLTEEAKEIVEQRQGKYPGDEFVFMSAGRQLTNVTFNRHLKTACEKSGVKYRSYHQVRFTNASTLYDEGVALEELSLMMGHSNTATTLGYLRQREIKSETAKKVRQALMV